MPGVDMGVPTLSQIEGWDTAYLESAAQSWTATGLHWEDTFTAVHRGSLSPGGTVWEGEGAESAQQRTFADLVRVRGFSDHLFEAAALARRGADELDYLKRSALDAVDKARTAGFTVGEDLSVSDRSVVPLGPAFAVRQAQAQTLAAEIRIRAAALSAADHRIAAKITTATAPLSGIAFEEEAPDTGAGQTSANGKNTVQAVDYKEAPAPTDPGDKPNPYDQNPRYPNRNNLGQYGAGNSRDGKAEEEAALANREAQTGIPIERQQVRATHPEVTRDGKPQWRYYDGLEPTGNPDEYIGIEAKGHEGAHQSAQDTFDGAVSPQSPAEAVLNGRKIKIVGAQPAYPAPGWTPPDSAGPPAAQQAPMTSGLPPWLQGAPTQIGPANPLLAPYPGASMPGMPTSHVTGALPDSGFHLPHIDLPSPKDCATGVVAVGGAALLLLLAPLGAAGG